MSHTVSCRIFGCVLMSLKNAPNRLISEPFFIPYSPILGGGSDLH